MNQIFKNYTISPDPQLVDFQFVYDSLKNETYWGKNFDMDELKKAIHNSVFFGLYDAFKRQVGFVRVITDYMTLAYLTDTFIRSDLRNRGLGRFMIQEVLKDDLFKNVRRWLLVTADAHEFYKTQGFNHLKNPTEHLEKLSLHKQF